jgi:hypothetical protein
MPIHNPDRESSRDIRMGAESLPMGCGGSLASWQLRSQDERRDISSRVWRRMPQNGQNKTACSNQPTPSSVSM